MLFLKEGTYKDGRIIIFEVTKEDIRKAKIFQMKDADSVELLIEQNSAILLCMLNIDYDKLDKHAKEILKPIEPIKPKNKVGRPAKIKAAS